MPFKSAAQRRMLFANAPALAQRFAAETPKGANLPERVANTRKLSPASRAKQLAKLRERYGSNAQHHKRKRHHGHHGAVPPQFQKGGGSAGSNAG